MTSMVDCSLLMPVLNEEGHIRSSIEAMRSQRFPGSLEFIVVDGCSTDRTRALLTELQASEPRLRVFENPRGSTASGLNVALREARGRWVARIDAHAVFPADYAALGVERLRRGGTRWVSGPSIARGAGRVSRAVSLALRTPLGTGGSRKWATERDVERGEYELDAGVFAGVWERSTLLEYGGWDEDWERNQDSEIAGRFLARDEPLICIPAMAAEYVPRDSLRSLWRQYYEYGIYREKTARRHPHTMRRSHLLAPALVTTCFAALLGPKRLRPMARAGAGVYTLTIAAAGARASLDAERRSDAALVPAVLVVMHLAHGSGALRGALRHGPPLAAIARALGLGRLARRFGPSDRELRVNAPSLSGGVERTPASVPERQPADAVAF
jgi:glycosyltransferase involved in cell wall biosynthesis